MDFKELQSFFSGGFSQVEKNYLLSLFQDSNGREVLESAFEEGWNQSANGRIHNWNPDLCFMEILRKIKSDQNTYNNNNY